MGAVVVGGAGVVSYAMAEPGTEVAGTAAYRAAAVHTLGLETKADRKVVPQKSTKPFNAVSVTWKNPKDKIDGTAQFRARDAASGAWGSWTTLPKDTNDADGAEREGTDIRGGTASVPTQTAANGVEVRVVDADGKASGLPSGMDVKLIDPGTGTRKGAPESAAFTSDETPPEARPSTVVKPTIIPQSVWGPGLPHDGTPTYDTEIKAAVVHHTGVDLDNQVPCAQTAQRLREIQQDHVAKGYYDIGYNFVVDRCGQIFEGRTGGMDLPVHGAHDYGFNTDTVGISYIGNFQSAKPTKAALDSIARVAAWKFGQYGIKATDKVTLTSNGDLNTDGNKVANGSTITLPRVFGHKDTNATACPGTYLYPKLGRIATLAATPGVSHALASQNVVGDATDDIVAGLPKGSSGGQIALVPGSVNGPTATGKKLISQSTGDVPGAGESGDEFGASTATGDINGDGNTDVVVGQPGEDDTTGHSNRGAYTILNGPDFTTGTGVNIDGSYELTNARFGSAVAVGDFNADGKADVFAASTGTGGTWSARYGDGWDTDSTITTTEDNLSYEDAASGDFNQDGYADVALNYRDGAGLGKVVWYKGGSGGLRKAATLSVKGGRSIGAGDINGDGIDDIAVGQPYTAESGAAAGGQVTFVKGSLPTSTTAGGLTATGAKTVHQDTSGVPGAAESGDAMGASIAVGDYNLDGYADVLAGAPNEDITRTSNRSNAGNSILLKGTSTGITGTGALTVTQDTTGVPGSSESNDNLGSAVALTDLSGYGRADLVLGSAGENTAEGMLTYVPSNSSGLGLSSTKNLTTATLGTPATGRLGTNLAP
ncbi:N-acetylmuramoyl-L-alanine amidase [Streptomyces endophyticus]|uniref:N-acetylmuramoyl-L-alanine amidase n=1 Tax=Streptomyces endophyticus TaxID=714166 RepID=A0ABU6F463_9ACTN|nr:N-acetylmuramoyl-L-alanine amidase [Streptomyces endophyticus]MEB8338629.1 N-acetylmuramoyl-L-alanine amidase [Streptomyces endophyticus]